jgi:hypothetical protein
VTLHTIGNLTLTTYNKELSNKSFKDKKILDKGLDKRYSLNEFVLKQDIWNDKAIVERTGILTERAIKIWPYCVAETPSSPRSKFIPTSTYGLDDDIDFKWMEIGGNTTYCFIGRQKRRKQSERYVQFAQLK